MPSPSKQDYAKFRTGIIDFITEELLGPADPEEVLSESPISRYSTGVLFPQVQGSIAPSAEVSEGSLDEDSDIAGIEYSSTFYPSAMGISFLVKQDTPTVTVNVSAGSYRTLSGDDIGQISVPLGNADSSIIAEDPYLAGFFEVNENRVSLKIAITKEQYETIQKRITDYPVSQIARRLYTTLNGGWRRMPFTQTVEIDLHSSTRSYVLENPALELRVNDKHYNNKDVTLVTLSLLNKNVTEGRQNGDESLTFFQPRLHLSGDGNIFLGMDEYGFSNDELSDDEEQSLKLLYRENHHYAVGHGVSVEWGEVEPSTSAWVATTYVPHYEMPGVSFEIESTANLDLEMDFLASAERNKVIENLKVLAEGYASWIKSRELDASSLAVRYQKTAHAHMQLCRESLARIRQGIDLLAAEDNVFRAFQLANKAMLMQRRQTTHVTDGHKWRPFQLAFILQSLQSVTDQNDKFRDVVDLIWFPTGGGKTEAYLGLTAFTIFKRRLTVPDEASGGTTVLMRYTLRLLTAQQFQRACTLICACEILRRENASLGSEEISIGLWLGENMTPNNLSKAKRVLKELQVGREKNKFQVLECPWCSAVIANSRTRKYTYRPSRSAKTKKDTIVIYCSNHECPFSSALPVKVVDEDIYNEPPTLLFGTVDKFASLAWNKRCRSIFARAEDDPHLPPELIIQDELHLISGALGTMVGLYETVIDILCTHKGIRPKLIASTATIRRAKEQAKQLYARDVRQFPAQGTTYRDSYFSKIVPVTKDNPGRLYMGLMPSGKSSTTLQLRLMASALQGVDLLPSSDEVKDQYWTFVTYCNSIRELGSSNSIVRDDVGEYSNEIANRKGSGRQRFIDAVEELTSRRDGDEIPVILQKLEVPYSSNPEKKTYPISVLLATSMISVGVDIDRLGVMMVLGQPKTTAEYIQASSRVGRKNPGLVITQFSPSKSRDRSHYEKFLEYHRSIYRWVEPTSVTPFSGPARDRALHAVLVSLIRHELGINESDAIKHLINSSPEEIKGLVDQVLRRVTVVDSEEYDGTRKDLLQIIDTLTMLSEDPAGVAFSTAEKSGDEVVFLRRYNEKLNNLSYPTSNSMRSTDAVTNIEVIYDEW